MHLGELQDLQELETVRVGSRTYQLTNSVLKPENIAATCAQGDTQEAFGFKWSKEDTYSSVASRARVKKWLLERYLSPALWLKEVHSSRPLVLDAGCGAGLSGWEYWGSEIKKIQYVGVDISSAVDVARKRFEELGVSDAIFLQESISNLPFNQPMFDIIFSEGVLHHTDDTRVTFEHLCQFLKPGGLFMFYVYRKKGPIREFADDYIREKMQNMSQEQRWKALESLTQLGIQLGELDIEIDIPQDIALLEIPAGKINLQRFFYWHIFKAFYDPTLSFDEMQHINFDWYAPKNAKRHTIEEVRSWCVANGLEIKHEVEEPAGLTCIAKKNPCVG